MYWTMACASGASIFNRARPNLGGQTDRILDPLGFEALVDARHGEGGISPEIDAQDLALIAPNDRLQNALQPSALCTLPGRRTQRSRSPNWLNTNSGW